MNIQQVPSGVVDKTGIKFGRLTVIGYIGKAQGRSNSLWLCKCECGNETEVMGFSVGKTKSCGCLQKEVAAKRVTTHNLSSCKEYGCWAKMLQRCNNPRNPSYPRYGGRGISVCREWHTFENFISDMGMKPSPKHSIDRINNDGNYEPSNCWWAPSSKVQNRNTSLNRVVEFNGEKMCVTAWAERLGIDASTLNTRLKRGWTTEEAMTGVLTNKSGKGCNFSKITEKDVHEIRELRALGLTQTAISARFGVTQACVSDILMGKTWKHI